VYADSFTERYVGYDRDLYRHGDLDEWILYMTTRTEKRRVVEAGGDATEKDFEFVNVDSSKD